ncbi:MAG: ATP-binding protein [Hormoscilla sp.]
MKEIEIAASKLRMLDHVPVGLCLLRQDLVVLFWNRCLSDWTKIPTAEILGRPLDASFPHLQAPKYKLRLQQVFEKGFPAVFSSQLHQAVIPAEMPNGRPRIQQTTITAVPAFTDDPGFYALISIQDVTELTHRIQRYQAEIKQRKRTEAELKRSNAELEQFAYVASHDLQEPLRMVTSFTTLLGQRYSGKLDAQADQIINFAVDGATRMQALINDLLMYSRVGRYGKDFQLTDSEAALQKAIANLQFAISQSGADINADPLPTLLADEGQLVQLFQNLLSNAIKYRREEDPEVNVGSSRQEGEWLFWVKDNGIGIEEKQQERVFLIFQRLHTRQEYPGTGIGLAICKKIVERHDGRIWVESAPGIGSTFKFTLSDKPNQE